MHKYIQKRYGKNTIQREHQTSVKNARESEKNWFSKDGATRCLHIRRSAHAPPETTPINGPGAHSFIRYKINFIFIHTFFNWAWVVSHCFYLNIYQTGLIWIVLYHERNADISTILQVGILLEPNVHHLKITQKNKSSQHTTLMYWNVISYPMYTWVILKVM